MDRLINENAVLSAIGEWIAHNEHTYTNATEYLKNRVKAIKTAEQEPTAKEDLVVEDCISRKDLIEYANNLKDGIGITANDIARFPSIQPKPKTGYWISIKNKRGTEIAIRCDCCGNSPKHAIRSDFCPNCGVKIVEPQESKKVNCKATKCENCTNHGYCDYEPYKAENTSNCDSCEYQNEVDGSNCYECVKGIRNNYKAKSEE